jgi:hypothetical protein
VQRGITQDFGIEAEAVLAGQQPVQRIDLNDVVIYDL